jgi:hypothetical protein
MRTGQKNQSLITGRIAYGHDGTDAYPFKANTAGEIYTKPQVREAFIFRPGASALASTSAITGMVLSGVRTGSGTISTAGTANSTYWGPSITYEPLRAGKIDGLTTGGIVGGAITIGSIAAAATCLAKHTIRIRNKDGTWTTCLAVSGTVAVGATTEVYTTYTMNYLQTTANFNAVPFEIAIGAQSNEAGTAAICRVMESSYISGEFEPE